MTPEPDTTPERELRHERRDQPCPKCGQFYGTHYCDGEPAPAPPEGPSREWIEKAAAGEEAAGGCVSARSPEDEDGAGQGDMSPRSQGGQDTGASTDDRLEKAPGQRPPAPPSPPEGEGARLVAEMRGCAQAAHNAMPATEIPWRIVAHFADRIAALLAQKDAEIAAFKDEGDRLVDEKEALRAELAQERERVARIESNAREVLARLREAGKEAP